MEHSNDELTVEYVRKAYEIIKKHENKFSNLYFYRGEFLTLAELNQLGITIKEGNDEQPNECDNPGIKSQSGSFRTI